MKSKLSDVINIIGGGTPKTSIAEYWGGDIPWLSVKDFNNDDRYVFSTEKTITKAGLMNSSTNLLEVDDIIISARGTVGELAMIPFPMAFNQSCYGIRGKTGVVFQTYLYYLLKYSVRLLKRQTHGSVFDTITRDTFANILVDLPPLSEQRTIAATLCSLDDKIENNRKINQCLEQMAQAIFTNFLSQGNGTFKALRDVAQINTNTYSKKDNWEFVNYLDTGNITDGKISIVQHISLLSEKLPSRAKRKIFANDIVYSTVRPNQRHFGIITYPLEQMLVSTGFVVIRSKNQAVCNELIYLHLTSVPVIEKLQRIAEQSTSTYPSIKPSDIGDIQILVPSTSEFDNIKALLKPIFQVIGAKYAENIRLATIRDTLLPKLLSGEIRIPEAKKLVEEIE